MSSFSSSSTTRTSSSGGLSRVRRDDRVPAGKRPDRDALELEHRVVGEALAERLPVAMPDGEVVPRDVLVEEVSSRRQPEVLADERIQGAPHPPTLAAVRLSALALPHEPDALGVPHRPLVELVDLELEAVVAEVEEEVTLQLVGRLVGEPAAAKVRVDGQPAEVRDPAAPVSLLELHHPGQLPVLLDHEDAELGGLTQGALDPLQRRVSALARIAARNGATSSWSRSPATKSASAGSALRITQRILRQVGGARAARPRSRARRRPGSARDR